MLRLDLNLMKKLMVHPMVGPKDLQMKMKVSRKRKDLWMESLTAKMMVYKRESRLELNWVFPIAGGVNNNLDKQQ